MVALSHRAVYAQTAIVVGFIRVLTEVAFLFTTVFFFQAEDGIRDLIVTGVQTCALPILGLNGLEIICEKLILFGMNPETPAALIEKGTTRNQKTYVSDLKGLPIMVRAAGARAPTLIIVGSVVLLQDKLSWFKSKNN